MDIIKKKPSNGLHPWVPELQDQLRQGKISRREFLRYATLLGVSLGGATALAACGAQPTPAPAPTAAPAAAAPTAVPPTAVPPTAVAVATAAVKVAAGTPLRGGTLTIASRVQRIDDPARLSWIEGVNQWRQVCEYLTYTDPKNITMPWLLKDWQVSDDLKTWTLNLKQGIKFNDGTDFTADDVVFNIQRWLDPEVGSSMLGLMSYLKPTGIEKVDDYTVKLNLDSGEIAVPENLFHYPAMIVPKTFEGDITKQPIGTGPFLMDKYVETERAELSARTDYWQNGTDGKPLPYLDKLIYLDLGQDSAAQVAALKSGQVDDIFNPSAEIWQAVKDMPEVGVYSVDTGQTFVIRMRADQKPWDDPKVRQRAQEMPGPPEDARPGLVRRGCAGHRHARRAGASGVLRETDPAVRSGRLQEVACRGGLPRRPRGRADDAGSARRAGDGAGAQGKRSRRRLQRQTEHRPLGGLLERLDGGTARHHNLGAPPDGQHDYEPGLHCGRRRQARRVE